MYTSVRSAVTVAVVAAGLVAATAAPAYAGIWTLQDGFESAPAATWWFEGSDDDGSFGTFAATNGIPHTGTRYATITRDRPGWTSVARMVHLTPAANHSASCGAQIWLQEKPGTKVNVEVIDPATWNYLAVRQVTLPAGYPWKAYSSGSWRPGPVDVVVRISVLSDGYARVKVDDLTVQCSYT